MGKSELDDISVINADPETYKFKLVTLKGVTFQNGGTAIFAPEDSKGQEEAITDAHGNTLVVRTSGFANFAANKLPKGKGNLTGILGRFRGNWQFTIRTAEDIKDFVEVPEEGGQGGETQPGVTETVFEETFATGVGTFTIENKEMASALTFVWKHDNFKNPGYMKASAFKDNVSYASDGWLISPEIDLTAANAATLTFDHAINKGDVAYVKTNHLVNVSKDNGQTWNALSGVSYPAGNSWEFSGSGDVNLSAYVGSKIKIAFQYKSSDGVSDTWEVKNVKVTATKGGSGSGDGGNVIEPTPNE